MWLDNALDHGISEFDFWNMTPGELERVLLSKQRTQKAQLRQEAVLDYTLAGLIARNIARTHSSSVQIPNISEVYPELFDAEVEEEILQEKKDELSAMRFKLFTQSYNSRFKEGENERRTKN